MSVNHGGSVELRGLSGSEVGWSSPRRSLVWNAWPWGWFFQKPPSAHPRTICQEFSFSHIVDNRSPKVVQKRVNFTLNPFILVLVKSRCAFIYKTVQLWEPKPHITARSHTRSFPSCNIVKHFKKFYFYSWESHKVSSSPMSEAKWRHADYSPPIMQSLQW